MKEKTERDKKSPEYEADYTRFYEGAKSAVYYAKHRGLSKEDVEWAVEGAIALAYDE